MNPWSLIQSLDLKIQHLPFEQQSPLLESIGWALVHFIWQGIVVAGCLITLLAYIHRASAATRYLLGCFALLVMVVCPIFTLILILPTNTSLLNPPISQEIPQEPQIPFFSNPELPLGQIASSIDNQPHEDFQGATQSEPIQTVNSTNKISLSRQILPFVVIFWISGVAFLSVRLCGSWLWVQRMKHYSNNPISIEWQRKLLGLAKRLGLHKSIQIVESTLVEVPTLIGWLKPVILLPVGFLTGMTPGQIEAILAHEFAHILRRDYLVNLLQSVVETVLFYHPAVWWVSHFIRTERENCCDDIAAKASGESWEYARALAALEGMRSNQKMLAMAATNGSLLHRIQRLAGISNPTTDRPTFWTILTVGLILLPLIIWQGKTNAALSPLDPTVEETSVEPQDEWGQAANGLQCRIVALDHSINDESTDFQKTVKQFAQGKEITFGVELKNIGQNPVQLAGVRYGDSYGPASGKWNANFYGPQLFDFEFTNASGKPVPRAARGYIGSMILQSGGSVHEIAPGKSLVVILRPSQFSAPMNYDLNPGSYRVKVKYLGVSEDTLTQLKKHWPDKPISKAWTGPATSNTIAFEILKPRNAEKPAEIQWGPETKGLRAGTEYRLRTPPGQTVQTATDIPINSAIDMVHHIQNVSKTPISLVSETFRQDDRLFVKDGNGMEKEITGTWYSGWPTLIRWTLLPGETATIAASSVVVVDKAEKAKDFDHPVGKTLVAKVGTFSLRSSLNLGGIQTRDPEGNQIPGKADWTGIIETGSTSLKIRDRSNRDDAQSLDQISLDQWTITRIEGKSIGIATNPNPDDKNSDPVRITVTGPGSLIMSPLLKREISGKDEAEKAPVAPVFQIQFQEKMAWAKDGAVYFKGKVQAKYQPFSKQDGETIQLECENLEIQLGTKKESISSTLTIKAYGDVRGTHSQIRIEAKSLILEPIKRAINIENGQLQFPDGTKSNFGPWVSPPPSNAQSAIPPTSPDFKNPTPGEPLTWTWKGNYPGRVLFVDPKGNPIPSGSFKAQAIRKQKTIAEGTFKDGAIEIPDCDGTGINITARAPGFEERTFSDIQLKPQETKRIELTPAIPARFQVVSSVDSKPVRGAKIRFFNKNSDKAGGGPFPMDGIKGPIWQTTGDDGMVTLDSLQKIDPNYPQLGSAVYFFYLEPPAPPKDSPPFIGRFVGPIRSGEDLGKIAIGPGLEVVGEIRGTKEELDQFAAEWDQPFELKTANPQAKYAFAVSQKLETHKEENRLVFHLKDLAPGKLRIVGNFSPHPHSVSHSYAKRDAKGTDLEMFVDLKLPITPLVITSKGIKIEK